MLMLVETHGFVLHERLVRVAYLHGNKETY
jgi:hypothetical protein